MLDTSKITTLAVNGKFYQTTQIKANTYYSLTLKKLIYQSYLLSLRHFVHQFPRKLRNKHRENEHAPAILSNIQNIDMAITFVSD